MERMVTATSGTSVVKRLELQCADITVRLEEDVLLKLVRMLRHLRPGAVATTETDDTAAHRDLSVCLAQGAACFSAGNIAIATFFEV